MSKNIETVSYAYVATELARQTEQSAKTVELNEIEAFDLLDWLVWSWEESMGGWLGPDRNVSYCSMSGKLMMKGFPEEYAEDSAAVQLKATIESLRDKLNAVDWE